MSAETDHADLVRSLIVERYARNQWWTTTRQQQSQVDDELTCARRRRVLVEAFAQAEERAS